MIHFTAIMDLRQEVKDLHDEINYGDLDEQQVTDKESDIQAIEQQIRELEGEADQYREGYDAGVEYHMGSGVMRDEWQGRSGRFRQGFDAAGQDS